MQIVGKGSQEIVSVGASIRGWIQIYGFPPSLLILVSAIQVMPSVGPIPTAMVKGATMVLMPVSLVSLAEPIATATGWTLQGTIVAMMPSWSIFPFAYQAPIILLAIRMADVPVRELNICLLLITAFALFVIVPLQFVWLWTLGVIG